MRRKIKGLCTAVLVSVPLLTGCPGAAKTATDSGDLLACVLSNWGQTPEQILVDCQASDINLVLDVIADIENVSGSTTYASDARVMQRLTKKKLVTPVAPSSSVAAGAK
jgi:hypothetical protein